MKDRIHKALLHVYFYSVFSQIVKQMKYQCLTLNHFGRV